MKAALIASWVALGRSTVLWLVWIGLLGLAFSLYVPAQGDPDTGLKIAPDPRALSSRSASAGARTASSGYMARGTERCCGTSCRRGLASAQALQA